MLYSYKNVSDSNLKKLIIEGLKKITKKIKNYDYLLKIFNEASIIHSKVLIL